jgi:hypothetical protein
MEVKMNNDKQVTSTHITIGEDYFKMDRNERRAFLRSLLSGMSPNPDIRKPANKNNLKKDIY